MPPELVAALLAAAERAWGFAANIEITLEANPTSFEAGRFQGFAAAGVNRLSIGVQSFDDQALAFLGRGHSADEALHVVARAQQLFARVSFDCIYALPGQTAREWEGATGPRAVAGHQSPVTLPADHRARHPLRVGLPATQAGTDGE